MKKTYGGNANKSGIYKIINHSNGRFYIGSCKRFKQRASEHHGDLRTNRHSNKFLQNDWNKCGPDCFEFLVFETIEKPEEERRLREQALLDEFYDDQVLCYNIAKTTVAIPRRVFSNDPDITKKVLSQKSKAMWADSEFRAKMKKIYSDPGFRKKQSENQKKVSQDPSNGNSAETLRKNMSNPETKAKLSKKLKEAWASDDGSRRKKASKIAKKVYEANKEKITKARVKARAKYYGKVVSPEGEVFEIYNAKSFIREQGFSQTFYDFLNGRYEAYKGWKRVE